MKIFFPILAAGLGVALLAGCGRSDNYAVLEQTIEQQNKTILDQQQTLLAQEQKLIDQEVRLQAMNEQLSANAELLKKLQAQLDPAEPAKKSLAADPTYSKRQVLKNLTGFNARLSASIGYGSYSDTLSDMHSNLAQAMLEIKDQSFVDQVNKILCLYDYAGDFWERFSRDGLDEISLTPTDRYKFSAVGVNFVDSYHPRPVDVRKFWVLASNQLQDLLDINTKELELNSKISRN